MKRFVKNEAIAPAMTAFLTLERETFQTYNQLLTAQERKALNFIGRAVALQSDKHLTLALETQQPLIEVDRLLMKVGRKRVRERHCFNNYLRRDWI